VDVSGKGVEDPQWDAFWVDDRLDVAAEVVGLAGAPQVDLLAFLGDGLVRSQSVSTIAADEGIELAGKKATRVLMRRMKQAIGEFHALNVMEQA
jgi:hypothetical protein